MTIDGETLEEFMERLRLLREFEEWLQWGW
jgi:hypothetical protein